MLGGYFDHQQSKISMIATEVEQLICSNNDAELDYFGEPKGKHFSTEIIEEFEKAAYCLKKAAIYAQRIDLLVSGADSPDRFMQRLKYEIGRLNADSPNKLITP